VSKYLLDTNVISELRKPRPHGAVVAWAGGLDASQIFLAGATLGEPQPGIERAHEQDWDQAREIEAWIDGWVDGRAGSFRVLPIAARMIAATARIHNLTVATRNTRDFERLGVRVVDPFRPAL